MKKKVLLQAVILSIGALSASSYAASDWNEKLTTFENSVGGLRVPRESAEFWKGTCWDPNNNQSPGMLTLFPGPPNEANFVLEFVAPNLTVKETGLGGIYAEIDLNRRLYVQTLVNGSERALLKYIPKSRREYIPMVLASRHGEEAYICEFTEMREYHYVPRTVEIR